MKTTLAVTPGSIGVLAVVAVVGGLALYVYSQKKAIGDAAGRAVDYAQAAVTGGFQWINPLSETWDASHSLAWGLSAPTALAVGSVAANYRATNTNPYANPDTVYDPMTGIPLY